MFRYRFAAVGLEEATLPRRVWTKPAGGNQVSIKFKVYEGSDPPINLLTIIDWLTAARGSPFWDLLKNVFHPIS